MILLAAAPVVALGIAAVASTFIGWGLRRALQAIEDAPQPYTRSSIIADAIRLPKE